MTLRWPLTFRWRVEALEEECARARAENTDLRSSRDMWAEKANALKGDDARRRGEVGGLYREIANLKLSLHEANYAIDTWKLALVDANDGFRNQRKLYEDSQPFRDSLALQQTEELLTEALAMLMWYQNFEQVLRDGAWTLKR